MRIRYVLIASFLLAFLTTPFIRKISLRYKIVDQPGIRKIHKKPVALLGGVAVFAAFLAGVFTNPSFFFHNLGVIAGGVIIFVLGLIDDIREIPALVRFLIQVLVALIVVFSKITIEIFPRYYWFSNAANITLTVLWIVGIINALNYIDGLDGLAVSFTIVACLSFIYVGYVSNQFHFLVLAAALLGSCLGFIRYNFYPAKIFLGDAGSNFIGYVLAVTAVMGNWAQKNAVNIFVPIFILGIPIFDMVFTSIMRIKERKVKSFVELLEYAGKDHLHHLLLAIGLSQRTIVALICLLSLSLGLGSVALYKSSINVQIFLIFQAIVVFTITGIIISAKKQSGH